MGVYGLWSVLDKCATPCDYSGLRGKRLAVDASIWMYQFSRVNASVDSKRAFIVSGIFRRLAKLIHFGIKPVFVFDGLPPLIKREELRRRAEQREKSENDVRKIASRLLKTRLKLLASGAKI